MTGEQNENLIDNKIISGVIWQQLFFLFFPLVIGNLFQLLYNTTDAIIVGKYIGKEALAAVGGTTSLFIHLLVGIFTGVSTGATVVIAKLYGEQDNKNLKIAVHTAVTLSIVLGIAITIIGYCTSGYILKLMNTPENIYNQAYIYFKIYFIGIGPSLLYNIGSAILRGIGDTKSPARYLIISCICNVILDLVFVTVINMGIAGVAIATIISQTICAILVGKKLLVSSEAYSIVPSNLRLNKKISFEIFRIGIPNAIQAAVYVLSNIFVQGNVNRYGTNIIAAWAAYVKIESIFWMVMNSFGFAVITFVGQNYGARKYTRVKESITESIKINLPFAVMFCIIYVVFARFLVGMFTNDENVIQEGIHIIKIMAPFYFTHIWSMVYTGIMRGCGKSFAPMVLSIFFVCVFRILWVAVMTPIFKSFDVIAISYPLSYLLNSIAFIIYYNFFSTVKKELDITQ